MKQIKQILFSTSKFQNGTDCGVRFNEYFIILRFMLTKIQTQNI